MSVGLVEVTRENVEALCRLRVAERQEPLVAPAAQTVAEASVRAGCLPARDHLRAPARRRGVGSDRRAGAYLVRFMVDVEWQGRGIGRRAVALVLDELRALGLEAVELSYVPVGTGRRAVLARVRL